MIPPPFPRHADIAIIPKIRTHVDTRAGAGGESENKTVETLYLAASGARLRPSGAVAKSVAEVERLHEVAREGDKRDFEVEPFATNPEDGGKLILRKMERTTRKT